MARHQIGTRIGAIRNSNESTVYAFGYGTYQGDEVPTDDVRGPFGRLGLFGIRNPKLLMDDGTVIWGCESWWGDETRTRSMIGDRQVELVKPVRSPATEREREEAAQIVLEATRDAERIRLLL